MTGLTFVGQLGWLLHELAAADLFRNADTASRVSWSDHPFDADERFEPRHQSRP
jgi:hypothetical protein